MAENASEFNRNRRTDFQNSAKPLRKDPKNAYVLVRDDRKENKQRLISRRKLYFAGLIYLQFSSIMGLEKERGLEENEGRF